MAPPTWAFWATLVVMLIGLVGVVLPILPDVVLIWLAAMVYAIADHFTTVGPITAVVLTLLAAVGVTTELWVSQVGGKLGGASWQALLAGAGLGAVGFVVGLLVGGIGSLPAAILGTLTGVLLVEYLRLRDWKRTIQAGAGWLAGCLISGVVKLLICLAMILLFVWQVLR